MAAAAGAGADSKQKPGTVQISPALLADAKLKIDALSYAADRLETKFNVKAAAVKGDRRLVRTFVNAICNVSLTEEHLHAFSAPALKAIAAQLGDKSGMTKGANASFIFKKLTSASPVKPKPRASHPPAGFSTDEIQAALSGSLLYSWKWMERPKAGDRSASSAKWHDFSNETSLLLTLHKGLDKPVEVTIKGAKVLIEWNKRGQLPYLLARVDRVREAVREAEAARQSMEAFARANVTWEWQQDDGKGWAPYQFEQQIELERNFTAKRSGCTISIGDFSYRVDFKAMTQTNEETDTSRNVRRAPKSVAAVPGYWEPDLARGEIRTVELEERSTEYKQAAALFQRQGCPATDYEIISIESVQCIDRWQAYSLVTQIVASQCKSNEPNERQLFHGTPEAGVASIVRTNFNPNFTETHLYGKGVYFAQRSAYSVDYAKPDNRGRRRMFIARVCVGESTVAEDENHSVVQCGRKANGHLYDSLVDDVDSPTIFVASMDFQAYPEFIVTFRKRSRPMDSDDD